MPSSSSSFSHSLSILTQTPATSPPPSSSSFGGPSRESNGNGNTNAVATHELPLPPPAAAISSACAACKYQRRKCGSQCMLAPYFPPERQQDFQNAHKLFGVSNIIKKLRKLSPPDRQNAVDSMVFEANMHASDASGGCLRLICELENKFAILQAELSVVGTHLAFYRGEPCNLETNPHEQPYGDQVRSSFVSLEDVNPRHTLQNQAEQEQRICDYFCFDDNRSNSQTNTSNKIGSHGISCNYVNYNNKEAEQEPEKDEIRPFIDTLPICSDNEEGEEQLVRENSADMASVNSMLDTSKQCSLGLGFSSF